MVQIEKLLQTELTRKQFLLALGTAVGGLFGLSTLIGLFTKNETANTSKKPGYGKLDYGP